MDSEQIEQAVEVAGESVATPTPNGDVPEAEQTHATDRDRSKLFEHSGYVHVGPGAEQCQEGESGKCNDPAHFHVWIRLPNPFQRTEITRKATAAKARRLRQLRDQESDGRVVIEFQIEEIVGREDRDALIDILVNKEFLQDHLKAMQEIAEDEDFKTIEDDRERLRALDLKDPEDRDAEEYEELATHVASYTERVNEARIKLQAPLREALAEKPIGELAEQVRDDLIEADAQQAFNDSYSKWEWFVCTLKPRDTKLGPPKDRVFSDINHLEGMAPEIHEALDGAYTQIEAASGRQLKGS